MTAPAVKLTLEQVRQVHDTVLLREGFVRGCLGNDTVSDLGTARARAATAYPWPRFPVKVFRQVSLPSGECEVFVAPDSTVRVRFLGTDATGQVVGMQHRAEVRDAAAAALLGGERGYTIEGSWLDGCGPVATVVGPA